MNFIIMILFSFSLSLHASWSDVYDQEVTVYKDYEKKLSRQFGDLPRKDYLMIALKELRQKGSLFFLQKYILEELNLGIFVPEHFAWLMEVMAKTNNLQGISENLKIWDAKGIAESLFTPDQKLTVDYARFLTSNETSLNDSHAKKLLNTKFHDQVIDRVVLTKLFKKDRKDLTKIVQMKKKLLYEDKIFLAILGECHKYGKEFEKFCKLEGKDLNDLKKKYPEIESIQML